jgi:WD40 repeat protein
MTNRAPLPVPDHELMSVIGRGSYGEVWLAQNVMGARRAVKIVRRDSFESERPYLRELDGIRQFEPLSRTHEGLVDVLHVGSRSDYFYYVMELADPENAEQNYRPRTLASVLASQGRLTVEECIHLSETLVGGLAHLHERGLLHRDVKPANIIYVEGVPKLADIGLVALAGASRSFVGTEGFVPREGMGTESADIYSMGKTLYEANTGLDRTQYPRLPDYWTEQPDRAQRIEINEIILRACEDDPAQRYPTARAMLAELKLLGSGRSVRRLRAMELGLARVRAGLAIAAASTVIAAIAWVWMSRRAASLGEANAQARYHLVQAQLASASAHNASANGGGKSLALLSVGAGAAVLQNLSNLPGKEQQRLKLALRREAAVALGRVDLRPLVTIGGGQHERAFADLARSRCLLVLADGRSEWHHVSGGPPTPGPQINQPPAAWLSGRLAPDARHLAVYRKTFVGMRMEVISMATGTTIAGGSFAGSTGWAGWLEGGRTMVWIGMDGTVHGVPVAEGARAFAFSTQHPAGEAAALSPDGASLAFTMQIDGRRTIAMMSLQSGAVLSTRADPGCACLAWSPDGRQLAAGSDKHIAVCMADGSGQPLILPGLTGHFHAVRGVTFLRTGHWLLSMGYDGTSLLWDAATARVICRLPIAGERPEFDAQGIAAWGDWENSSVTMAALECSPCVRWLHGFSDDVSPPVFSPDETQIACGAANGAASWRLADDQPFPPPTTHPAQGPVTPEYKATGSLTLLPGCLGLSTSADGSKRFTSTRDGVQITADGAPGVVLNTGAIADNDPSTACGPRGDWIAVGSFRRNVWEVFNLDGRRIANGPLRTGGSVAASPDGRWLTVCDGVSLQLLDTTTWKKIHTWPREHSTGLRGPSAFSPDSRLMAWTRTRNEIIITDTTSWQEVLTLTLPDLTPVTGLTFSPRGRWLAATGALGTVIVWDWPALCRELEKMSLGPLP